MSSLYLYFLTLHLSWPLFLTSTTMFNISALLSDVRWKLWSLGHKWPNPLRVWPLDRIHWSQLLDSWSLCSPGNINPWSHVLTAPKSSASWEAKPGVLWFTSTHSPAVPEQLDFSFLSWWTEIFSEILFFLWATKIFGLPFCWSFPEGDWSIWPF